MLAPGRKYQYNSSFLQLRVMRRDCSIQEMLAPKAAREEKEIGGRGEEEELFPHDTEMAGILKIAG